MRQMLATLCVALSLTLVALGGSDPTGEFCLGTMSVADPSAIMGPVLDTIVVSCGVEGTLCEELGWHVNSCLLRLFIVPPGAHGFASLVVTPRVYKVGGHHYVQRTSSRMISHHLSTSFPMAEK
jgi:hypothetical protein